MEDDIWKYLGALLSVFVIIVFIFGWKDDGRRKKQEEDEERQKFGKTHF